MVPALTSCSTDNSERARGAIEVSAVENGGVFVCGMLDAGSDRIPGNLDDFVPAGHVSVTIKNRPYNPFVVAPDYTPYGHFHITSVQVTWSAANPATPLAELTPFNYRADYDVTIPMNSEVTFNVMTVPFYMKNTQYFQDLLQTGINPPGPGVGPFTAVANYEFRGHDSGSQDTIVVHGSVIVEFIAVVVQD